MIFGHAQWGVFALIFSKICYAVPNPQLSNKNYFLMCQMACKTMIRCTFFVKKWRFMSSSNLESLCECTCWVHISKKKGIISFYWRIQIEWRYLGLVTKYHSYQNKLIGLTCKNSTFWHDRTKKFCYFWKNPKILSFQVGLLLSSWFICFIFLSRATAQKSGGWCYIF